MSQTQSSSYDVPESMFDQVSADYGALAHTCSTQMVNAIVADLR